MQTLVRYFTAAVYKPLLQRWLQKERVYRYGGIRLRIHPDVFHPGFFFSTRLLLKQLAHMPVHGRRLLELGAGSGLIAINAAKKGAIVTASDINPVAISYLAENAKTNGVTVTTIHSDLFHNIPPQVFDIIVINPPYYFKDPVGHKEYAWYCGSDGDYFRRLFSSIGNYLHQDTVIMMVVCEGPHRNRITAMAQEAGFSLSCIQTHRNLIEKNFIYRVDAVTAGKRYEKDTLIQPQEQ
jgi:release factor glutamine methyltransferase